MGSASASPGARRKARVARLGIAVLAFGWTLLLVTPGARADCPILDPACVVETTTETVDDVTDTVTGTVDDVTGTATDTVDDVANTVVGVVGQAVETVESTVDEVVDTVQDSAQPVVGTEPPQDPASGSDAVRPEPAGGPLTSTDSGDPQSRVGGVGSPTSADGEGTDAAGVVTRVTPTEAAQTLSGSSPDAAPGQLATQAVGAASLGIPDVREPIGFGFDNAAAVLAFPLALALAVAAFLVVQSRIDRREPKLALAPSGPDVVGFS